MQIHYSGTGRISRLKMYPMSLYESRESNGSISLKELFEHPEMDIDGIMSDMRIEDLIFAACRGGWPSALRKKSDAAKLIVASDYLKNVCETDISTVDGVTRNPVLAELILKSYARNISTLAKKNSIYKDVAANIESLSMPTLDSYITALTRLFVIEDIDASVSQLPILLIGTNSLVCKRIIL